QLAVLQLNSGAGSAAPPATTAANMGRLTPVPWQILIPAGSVAAPRAAVTAPGAAVTTPGAPVATPAPGVVTGFVFNGDQTVLQRAPAFDVNVLNDLSRSDVSQRIFSAFGVDQNAGFLGTGAATGGTGVGVGAGA